MCMCYLSTRKPKPFQEKSGSKHANVLLLAPLKSNVYKYFYLSSSRPYSSQGHIEHHDIQEKACSIPEKLNMSLDSKQSVCVNHKRKLNCEKKSERKGNIIATKDWSRL